MTLENISEIPDEAFITLLNDNLRERSRMVHGDLTPANILVNRESNGTVDLRLVDFGLSEPMSDELYNTKKLEKTIHFSLRDRPDITNNFSFFEPPALRNLHAFEAAQPRGFPHHMGAALPPNYSLRPPRPFQVPHNNFFPPLPQAGIPFLGGQPAIIGPPIQPPIGAATASGAYITTNGHITNAGDYTARTHAGWLAAANDPEGEGKKYR